MAERKGQDFVLVRPRGSLDRVTVVAGPRVVRATRKTPARVTRGEWEVILKPRGILEIAGPAGPTSTTQQSKKPASRRWNQGGK